MKNSLDEDGISVIIVSYNNYEVIDACIESLYTYNDIGDRLQIIVVEQSPDEHIFLKLRGKYSKITIIRNENKGFGYGNNKGVEYAKNPYLLFLNPDTLLIEPVFEFAIKKFEEDEKLGLFGVTLLNYEKKENSSFNVIKPYGIINKSISKACKAIHLFIPSIMYIEGADMFVRKKAFEEIGRFDENIFMYCEESDICIRLKNKGWRTRYFREKRIIHLQGQCTNNDDKRIISATKKQADAFVYISKKNSIRYQKYLGNEVILQRILSKITKDTNKKEQRKSIESDIKELLAKEKGLL